MTLLGIHGHSAVVAHMLVTSGSQVEKGCLAAVGIADEGYPDGAVLFGIVVFF